jgi:hypothetical protein
MGNQASTESKRCAANQFAECTASGRWFVAASESAVVDFTILVVV